MPDETQKPLRILVVEDSPTHRALIQKVVDQSTRPWEVTVATNFSEALAALQATEQPFDLLLLDGRFPIHADGSAERNAAQFLLQSTWRSSQNEWRRLVGHSAECDADFQETIKAFDGQALDKEMTLGTYGESVLLPILNGSA